MLQHLLDQLLDLLRSATPEAVGGLIAAAVTALFVGLSRLLRHQKRDIGGGRTTRMENASSDVDRQMGFETDLLDVQSLQVGKVDVKGVKAKLLDLSLRLGHFQVLGGIKCSVSRTTLETSDISGSIRMEIPGKASMRIDSPEKRHTENPREEEN